MAVIILPARRLLRLGYGRLRYFFIFFKCFGIKLFTVATALSWFWRVYLFQPVEGMLIVVPRLPLRHVTGVNLLHLFGDRFHAGPYAAAHLLAKGSYGKLGSYQKYYKYRGTEKNIRTGST